MERKIGIAFVVLGLAALSPAPISHARVGSVKHPAQTQAQLAVEQKFNGVVPIVGQVPANVDEVGQSREDPRAAQISHDGDRSLRLGSAKADKVAAAAITRVSSRVEVEDQPDKLSWIYGLLIAAAGFFSWKLLQRKIEQSTPVPEFSKRLLNEFENNKA